MKKNLVQVAALFLLFPVIGMAQNKKPIKEKDKEIEEVVITGTIKQIKKSDSPVPITIVPSRILEQNKTSNLVDALYQINGINPQVNCNMCNTSDIGINGMGGPYTIILIDGAPMMSSLATVYGFSGIPPSIIERIEIMKGPGSAIYGSEAIGGVINVITKKPEKLPTVYADMNTNTWNEQTSNVGLSVKLKDGISTMLNIDGFYYDTPKDISVKDGYMDKTLQKKISIFNKWDFQYKNNRKANISLRYMNEDRHGGEMGWDKNDRNLVNFMELNNDKSSEDYNGDTVLPNGYTIYNEKYARGFRMPRFRTEEERTEWLQKVKAVNPNARIADIHDHIMRYQESIYTNRFEAVGKVELPTTENFTLEGAYSYHDQNSAYGTELFMATQQSVFAQFYWDKKLGNHDLLVGLGYRHQWFKDNTIASDNGQKPFITDLPGIFIQDMWKLGEKTNLLLGYRFDYDATKSSNEQHNNAVHSPRIAFKYSPTPNQNLRLSFGTGYRVVNIFSEDHRALNGQFQAVFGESLKPEKSIGGNFDYEGRVATESIGLTYSLGVYYTHFMNKIYPLRNNAKRTLIYYNVNGNEHAENIGASFDFVLNFNFPLQISAGVSYNNANRFEYDRDKDTGAIVGNTINKNEFEFSPHWMGVYSLRYRFGKKVEWNINGDWKGPMLLPTDKENGDPRPKYSPWFTKVNTQISYQMNKNIELYGGVKNIFNYRPKYALVRLNDPFDDYKDADGGLGFDTEYNYTQQQGVFGYFGVKLTL